MDKHLLRTAPEDDDRWLCSNLMKLSAPSLRTLLIISGVAVLALLAALWRGGQEPAPPTDHERAASRPTKMVGTSPLGHGSPPPMPENAGRSWNPSGPLAVGQPVVIGSNMATSSPRSSGVPLLSSPLEQPSPAGLRTTGKAGDVPAGTEATVTAVAAYQESERDNERRFVQVRLPDGRTGWVPESVVSARRD